ncbi:hypothetical protein [Neisseria dentiae]|uniref:hypothetical protein n=1 Tax=Neisseria dentiae TaxID=194197 RepID=UPI0035A076D0
MAIKNLVTEIQDVRIFKSERDKELACAFIQGAVYAWIGANRDKHFAVRDLFGGANAFVWQNTPLDPLWRNYLDAGKTSDEAFDLAAKAAGKLLKIVLHNDKREFLAHDGYVNSYSWVAEE